MKRFSNQLTMQVVVLLGLFLFSCCSLLRGEDIRTLEKELRAATGKNAVSKAEEVVNELVGIGTSSSAEVIFELASHRNAEKIGYDLFEVLFKGLVAHDTTACIDYYKKAFSGRNLFARVLAVDIAGKMTSEKSEELIVKGLEDDYTNVLEAALEAALRRKSKQAIPALIELYGEWSKKKVKDAVYYDIKETLINLTQENLEQVGDWKKWWEANKKSFDPKAIDSGTRTKRKRVLGGEDDPKFFGVPVSSKNAVFVIDISQSMSLVQKDDIPGLTRVRGVDQMSVVEKAKEKLTPENERLAKFWTRIWMAKRHLIQVLLGLRTPTKVNVVAFHTKPLPMNNRSFVVSKSTKIKAAKWVKGLKIRGYTATLDALKYAFSSDRAVNTVYFLSDGVPSKDGKTRDDTEEVLKEVLSMNRFRKIKIHTFGFHPYTMSGQLNPQLRQAEDFLKKLAEKTGGAYTAMKVDPDQKPPPDFH